MHAVNRLIAPWIYSVMSVCCQASVLGVHGRAELVGFFLFYMVFSGSLQCEGEKNKCKLEINKKGYWRKANYSI